MKIVKITLDVLVLLLLPISYGCVPSTYAAENSHSESITPLINEFVTAEGYKGVRFGMTVEEAKSAYSGGELTAELWSDDDSCYYLCPKGTDCEPGFMVVDDKIQRIDVHSKEILTENGVHVGTTVEKVEEKYLNSSRKPNFYTYPVEDILVEHSNGTISIFEQGEIGIISNFHVGLSPGIYFPEGCS